jgi:hypothetical protein
MTRRRHSNGKAQKAERTEQVASSTTAQDQPGRKHPIRTWLAGLLAAIIATTSPVWGPAAYGGIKGALSSGSSAQALTVIAEPTVLDDQGYTMATPDGALPGPQMRRLMTRESVATSPAFLSAVQALGGADVDNLSIQLVVTGNSTQGVRILDIRPVNLQRTKPLDGTLFNIPSQAGNATLRMMFDLDEPVPIARTADRSPPWPTKEQGDGVQCAPTADTCPSWFDDADSGLAVYPGGRFFDNETISLADHEQQVLNIRTEVEKSFATFDLEIDYIVGGASGDIQKRIVSDHGKPFRVTGISLGAKSGTWSYQAAYTVNGGNYSLCPVPDPQHISMSNYAALECPGVLPSG